LRRAVQQIPQHCDLRLNARMECRIHVGREKWGVIGWQHDAGIFTFGILPRVGASQAHIQRGNALFDEKSIVFGGRDGLGRYHVLLSERGFEWRSQALGQTGVVVDRVGRLVVFDKRFLLRPASQRLSFSDAGNGRQNLFPYIRFVVRTVRPSSAWSGMMLFFVPARK